MADKRIEEIRERLAKIAASWKVFLPRSPLCEECDLPDVAEPDGFVARVEVVSQPQMGATMTQVAECGYNYEGSQGVVNANFIANAPADVAYLLDQLAEREWRDISSAPKDGTRILVHLDGKTALGYWHDDLKEFPDRHEDADECEREHCGRSHEKRLLMWAMDGCTSWPPTHWMPLPPAPVKGSE